MKRTICIALLTGFLTLPLTIGAQETVRSHPSDRPSETRSEPTGERTVNRQPSTLNAPASLHGTWHGSLQLNSMKLNLVLHLTNDSTCTLDSPDQGAKDIAGVVKELTDEKVDVQFPLILATYTAELKDGLLKGTFKQRNFTLPLTMERGDLVRHRPQTPQPPFPYETREVEIETLPLTEGEPFTLAATLTLPSSVDPEGAPCLLLVTGSGLQNRDEELFEHKPFAVIADYLARHGIATLRYDDRGCGQSTGDPARCTTLDFAHDAEAALAYLRSLKMFPKIGVLGHSEGGAIAFMLASRRDGTPFTAHPDFIVTLAAPGIRGDTLIVEQTNALLRLNGQPENMTVRRMHLTMAMQPQGPWYEYFVAYDPADDISATRCPVLALNGSLDCQVLPQSNLSAIRQFSTSNPQLSTKEYPGLNHLFQHATTGAPTEYGIIEETISEEVLSDIATWVNSLK